MNLDEPFNRRSGEEDRQVADERISTSPLAASEPLFGARTSPSRIKGEIQPHSKTVVLDKTPIHSEEESTSIQQPSEHLPIHVVETLASGTDAELLKRPPPIRKGRERDYYRNPTVLGRLILHQKFGRAMKRAFHYPEEVSTWLCAKRRISPSSTHRPGEIVYTIKQLPIHIATSALGRTNDAKLLRLLNELISLLVFAYPEGAHEPDHRMIIPIQEAVYYCAAPETIALFLMARPEALIQVDQWGRTLNELNAHRAEPGKQAVQHLLDRDISFWKTAREEATLRLQRNTTHYPSAEDDTIPSQSVLASPNAEEDTIVSMAMEAETDPVGDGDDIAPLSWSQLEQRASAAEQLLTAVNEENFTLQKQMNALTTMVSARHSTFSEEMHRLYDENAVISEKLVKLEQLLEQLLVSDDVEKNQQVLLAMAEISSLAGLSDKSSLYKGEEKGEGQPTPPAQFYKEAKTMQGELSRKHQQQRDKIRKLRHIVMQYIATTGSGGKPIIEGEEEASRADVSTISALTNESAKSGLTTLIKQRRWHYNQGVVDRLPSRPRHPQIADDLSAILRIAASRQAQHSARHRRPDPAVDDLSVIFRLAARKDQKDAPYWEEDLSVATNFSPIDARELFVGRLKRVPSSPRPSTTQPGRTKQEIDLPAMHSASELQIFSDSVDSSGSGKPREELSARC